MLTITYSADRFPRMRKGNKCCGVSLSSIRTPQHLLPFVILDKAVNRKKFHLPLSSENRKDEKNCSLQINPIRKKSNWINNTD